MKHISLISLEAENFKGLGEVKINFNGKETSVYGRNASGKTSLLDCFDWLLFGTDSRGRSDSGVSGFQIRPTDESGKPIHGTDIKVEATLQIDDPEMTSSETLKLTKVQRENWVKRRGSTAPTFQGNSNSYLINGYPSSQKEFDAKLAEIISEALFRLITDPREFARLKWQEQRKILIKFVSEITDIDVLALDREKYLPIADDVMAVGAEKAKEKASATLRELKKLQAAYPIRIDEASKSIVPGLDADDIGNRKAELTNKLNAVLAERDTLTGAVDKAGELQKQMMKLNATMLEIENRETVRLLAERRKAQGDLDGVRFEVRSLADEMNRKMSQIDSLQKRVDEDAVTLKRLTVDYKERRNKLRSGEYDICPHCKRPYGPDEIEKARKDAQDGLDKIAEEGKATRASMDKNTSGIEAIRAEVASLKEQYADKSASARSMEAKLSSMSTEPDLSGNAEYLEARETLNTLKAKLSAMTGDEERKRELTAEEASIRAELRAVDADIAALEANKRAEERVEELREELADCSQKVANEEQKEFLLSELIKAKMDMLSDKINAHFKYVRFKLFAEQINGALKETCVMQVNSNGSFVDYLDANNAAQIQGGLDVIRALTELYGVAAPIWLDNRESVTDIPEMDTQIINLVVSPEDETLRVE